MQSLPPELSTVILEQLRPQDLRNVTSTCRALHAWSDLRWRHIEVLGETDALCTKLSKLLNLLGDDGAHPTWPTIHQLTVKDWLTPSRILMSLSEANRQPYERLDGLLTRFLRAATAAKHVILQMGGYSRQLAYPNAAKALFDLKTLRVLSLSDFNPSKGGALSGLLGLRSAPRTLTNVVIVDCHNFDLHGLLVDQPNLQTADVEGSTFYGVAVPQEIAVTWHTVRKLCIYVGSEANYEWLEALLKALRSGGLPSLRELSFDDYMRAHLFAGLITSLASVPLTALRFMISGDNGKVFHGFGPKLLESVFLTLPNLKDLCIDHHSPFVKEGRRIIHYNWPGHWESYRVAFAHAKRLVRFTSTICSVRVDAPHAYDGRLMATGFGPHLGHTVRARSRDLFAWCPALADVLFMAPPGMPDFAEHKSVAPGGAVTYTSTARPAGQGGARRFWIPPDETEVSARRHQWNYEHSEVREHQIWGWNEELDGYPLMDEIYDYQPTAADEEGYSSENGSEGGGGGGYTDDDSQGNDDEDWDTEDDDE